MDANSLNAILTIVLIIVTTGFYLITSSTVKLAKESNSLLKEELAFASRPSVYIQQKAPRQESKELIEYEIINLSDSYALLPKVTLKILRCFNGTYNLYSGNTYQILPVKLNPWEKRNFKYSKSSAKYDVCLQDFITHKMYEPPGVKFIVIFVNYRRVSDLKLYTAAYIDNLEIALRVKSTRLARHMSFNQMQTTDENEVSAANYIKEEFKVDMVLVRGILLENL
jgi:hypothetical protein